MSDKYDEQARRIMGEMWDIGWGPLKAIDPHDGSLQTHFVSKIAAALRAAASVPDGHVRLPGGKVVKYIGDPEKQSKTDDGAIEFPDSRPWHLFDKGEIVQQMEFGGVQHPTCGRFGSHHRPRYSTRAAAEAAREKGTA